MTFRAPSCISSTVNAIVKEHVTQGQLQTLQKRTFALSYASCHNNVGCVFSNFLCVRVRNSVPVAKCTECLSSVPRGSAGHRDY
jgi:hypothetical protein